MAELIGGGYLLVLIYLVVCGICYLVAWVVTNFSVHILHSPALIIGDRTRYYGKIRKKIKRGSMINSRLNIETAQANEGERGFRSERYEVTKRLSREWWRQIWNW